MLNLHIDPDYCQKGPGPVERWRFDPEEERGYTHRFSIPRNALGPIEVPAHREWDGANRSAAEAMEMLAKSIPGELLEVENTFDYSALVAKVIKEFRYQVHEKIRAALKSRGFEFETDVDYFEFVEKRVVRQKILGDNVGYYYLIDGDEDILILRIDETINLPTLENLW